MLPVMFLLHIRWDREVDSRRCCFFSSFFFPWDDKSAALHPLAGFRSTATKKVSTDRMLVCASVSKETRQSSQVCNGGSGNKACGGSAVSEPLLFPRACIQVTDRLSGAHYARCPKVREPPCYHFSSSMLRNVHGTEATNILLLYCKWGLKSTLAQQL